MARTVVVYVVALTALVAALWVFGQFFSASTANEAEVRFVIEPNQSVFDIGKKLAQQEIISSPSLFVFYSLMSGNFSRFQPGAYSIPPLLDIRDIISRLVQGPAEVEVVIVPGMTLAEIDRLLTEEGVLDDDMLADVESSALARRLAFLGTASTLEGFLMPDTYRFYLSSTPQAVAETMLENFARKTEKLLGNRSDVTKIVTVASMIEKEVVFDQDKPLVAGIIYNRLAINMPLQIDAAVVYGICGGAFLNCPPLTRGNFAADTPYNTYLYKGLPPTPISNPSVGSIEAAAHPRTTSYFYYLSDRATKKTYFSTTLEEHNEKRARYLGL